MISCSSPMELASIKASICSAARRRLGAAEAVVYKSAREPLHRKLRLYNDPAGSPKHNAAEPLQLAQKLQPLTDRSFAYAQFRVPLSQMTEAHSHNIGAHKSPRQTEAAR